MTHAVESLAQATDAHKAEKSKYKKLNAEVTAMEKNKEHGIRTRGLWMRVERMLRTECNVYASTHHGGDMEGNQCRRLIRNATVAMNRVKDILLESIHGLSAEDQATRAPADEVLLFTSAFERLFQYMDVLSHYGYQPMGSMTNEDLIAAEKVISSAATLWRNLMPTIPMKVHGWQHLLEDLKRFRGLKSHNEHGIERAHQIGKKHDKRLACLREFEKKHMNILRHTQTSKLQAVIAMDADTETKRRKRKKDNTPHGLVKQQERTKYIKDVVNLPPFLHDIPTLISLAKATKKSQNDQEH